MSKRQFKSQASSSRAISGTFAFRNQGFGGSGSSAEGHGLSSSTLSPLSYVTEPPDLSEIAEPSVTVALKNLSKKDSTTKAKALEELDNYVLARGPETGGVEDALLEAWIKSYPRTSIDSSRRVRQLAHTLQGHIAVSCGKRIARHMPKLVGAWSAGLYDNDRPVAKAARDSFRQVFPTQEKISAIWRVYQFPILEYSRDAILRETVQTLSDERTVSPDDAEAKYARVVGTSISVITNMLAETSAKENTKERELYDSLFSDMKLWEFSSHPDAFVRRAVYKLLTAVLPRQHTALDYAILSTTTVAEALNINQSGSAYDYSEVLCLLTKTKPEVWTGMYSAKKPAVKGLRQFLRKGSQGGPTEYWRNIERLISYIPSSVIAPPLDGNGEQLSVAKEILESLHDGILKEPRGNLLAAWKCYVDVAVQVATELAHTEDRWKFLKAVVLPLFAQFITPRETLSRWAIGISQAKVVSPLAKVFQDINKLGGYHLLEEEWWRYSEVLVEHVKTLQPEQSKDYDKSQQSVAAEVNKWFTLIAETGRGESKTVTELFTKTSMPLIECAMDVLRARVGKPYGAAAAIEAAVRFVPSLLIDRGNKEIMARFLKNDIPSLLLSPSSPQLIAILCAFEGQQVFEEARDATLQALIGAPDSPTKNTALQTVILSPGFQNSPLSAELNGTILKSLHQAIKGDENRWDLVIAALDSPSTPSELTGQLLTAMTESLSVEGDILQALHGLLLTTQHNANALKPFSTTDEGSKLLSRLLFLTEFSAEDVAQQAVAVNEALESVLTNGQGPNLVSRSKIELINRELDNAGPDSLSVDSLIDQASKLLRQGSREDKLVVATQILPSSAQWSNAMKNILDIAPNVALAITNPLGGAVYMVNHQDADTDSQGFSKIIRDSNGYAPVLRMAIYASELIETSEIFELLSTEQRTYTVSYLILLLNLANDNLGLHGANDLWSVYNPDVDDDMSQFVARTQALVAGWLKSAPSSDLGSSAESGFLEAARHEFLGRSQGLTATAYNYARAFSVLQAELSELYGTDIGLPMGESLLKSARKNSDVFFATTLLTGYKPRKESVRLCNELVSSLTGLKIVQNDVEALRQLVILNAILQNQDDIADGMPQQRIVFLSKHLISYLGQDIRSPPITAEILKSLRVVLPVIKGIYGSHWSEILRFNEALWSRKPSTEDQELPVIHASLRLYATLRSLVGHDDGNEDLDDAWKESISTLSVSLVDILKHSQAIPDEASQPLRMVRDLLAREIAKNPIEHLEDPSELYPLLQEDSHSVQNTAYSVLHRHIPSAQEQISLDVAFSKENARLPDELLSLILGSPTPASLADANFRRIVTLQLRGYLLSWKLIFDHFTNSSYKVKADYVENISQGTYLVGLLELIVHFLGHSRNRPVDASKFEVTSYTPDMEESPEKDTQWLMIHLYYLALRHLPALSKAWWMACQNRQTVLAVEAWTEKYISPLIIAAELDTVNDWIPTQPADTQALTIKVNQRAKEINAGYEVDDQMMRIAIKLPPSYPLHQATVEGINRVGVDEKRWNAWLLNTQGVITFSNGSLIDGLLAFRRNVLGALKGQSECAICYSIISADKQLPNKRCGTCKNTFHSLCLYKWFRSSNSSSCPLCRNAFNYA